MNALKSILPLARPMIDPAIKEGQKLLKNYLDSIELHGDETDARVLTEFDPHGTLWLIVCAFSGDRFARKIRTFNANDLMKLLKELK